MQYLEDVIEKIDNGMDISNIPPSGHVSLDIHANMFIGPIMLYHQESNSAIVVQSFEHATKIIDLLLFNYDANEVVIINRTTRIFINRYGTIKKKKVAINQSGRTMIMRHRNTYELHNWYGASNGLHAKIVVLDDGFMVKDLVSNEEYIIYSSDLEDKLIELVESDLSQRKVRTGISSILRIIRVDALRRLDINGVRIIPDDIKSAKLDPYIQVAIRRSLSIIAIANPEVIYTLILDNNMIIKCSLQRIIEVLQEKHTSLFITQFNGWFMNIDYLTNLAITRTVFNRVVHTINGKFSTYAAKNYNNPILEYNFCLYKDEDIIWVTNINEGFQFVIDMRESSFIRSGMIRILNDEDKDKIYSLISRAESGKYTVSAVEEIYWYLRSRE